jgi:hypothetical protein
MTEAKITVKVPAPLGALQLHALDARTLWGWGYWQPAEHIALCRAVPHSKPSTQASRNCAAMPCRNGLDSSLTCAYAAPERSWHAAAVMMAKP